MTKATVEPLESQSPANDVVFDAASLFSAAASSSALKPHKLLVPELNGSVYVKGLTAAERDAHETEMVETKKNGQQEFKLANFRARLVVKTLVDADGNRLFENGDRAKLGQLPAIVINRIWTYARELSGMSGDDDEDAEGNSEATENVASA